MQFQDFNTQLKTYLTRLLKDADRVFIAKVDKDVLWNTYLDSFPPGTNKVYRERREYDCNCCRRFIKELGALVVIKVVDGLPVRHSIWNFDTHEQFVPVTQALNAYVQSCPIADQYLGLQQNVGTAQNREWNKETNTVVNTWGHFNYVLPKQLCYATQASTIGTVLGAVRTMRDVFKRSLEELTEDSVLSVLELTAQGSLYKGDEWVGPLNAYLALRRKYHALPADARELFTWVTDPGPVVAKIRNHSIGVLLQDISGGMDLDEAVRRYEAIVAPSNYKRPKAIFTQKMLAEAQTTVESLGLTESLPRRFAHLDDISVANTIFVDRAAARRIAGDVFSEMATDSAAVNPKSFSKAEEVPLDRFLTEVLPGATSLEVLFEGRHAGNLVSLIAPQDKEAPSLFKWSSGFSWAYAGNITDSMRQNVKAAGGDVDGVLRFSIQWNDDGEHNQCDYDAHCRAPSNEYISFRQKNGHASGGKLDVDIQVPRKGEPAVENITWPDTRPMREGEYKFSVHNYAARGGNAGFAAEVEFNGEIHRFEVRRILRQGETVEVATVFYSRSEGFRLVKSIEGTSSGRTLWGLKTGQFHKAQIVMHSPNHWDGEGVGNKHVLFMLTGAVNDEAPNGFFNEFLRQDLDKHKRVFEALGAKMRVAASDDQLSGIGFSSTKRDTLVCRVTGRTARVVKVLL